jgi:hypothetical protein
LIIALGISSNDFIDSNHISEQPKKENSSMEPTEVSPFVDLARSKAIDEAQTVNQKADDRIKELEAIEGKPMPEAVKKNVRRMTNHEFLVTMRARFMGITVEEYKVRFPKGGFV